MPLIEKYDDGRVRWFKYECDLCGVHFTAVGPGTYCYDCGKQTGELLGATYLNDLNDEELCATWLIMQPVLLHDNAKRTARLYNVVLNEVVRRLAARGLFRRRAGKFTEAGVKAIERWLRQTKGD